MIVQAVRDSVRKMSSGKNGRDGSIFKDFDF